MEHDFGKNIVPFTMYSDDSNSVLRYWGTDVSHSGYLSHIELRKMKNEKNKYLLFMTGTGMFDNNIDITKWKCTKLSY